MSPAVGERSTTALFEKVQVGDRNFKVTVFPTIRAHITDRFPSSRVGTVSQDTILRAVVINAVYKANFSIRPAIQVTEISFASFVAEANEKMRSADASTVFANYISGAYYSDRGGQRRGDLQHMKV